MRAPADASSRNFARTSSPAPTSSTWPPCRSRNTGRNRMQHSASPTSGVDWNYFLYMCLSTAAKRKLFLLYCGATLELSPPEAKGQEMHLLDTDSAAARARQVELGKAASVPQI